MPKGINKMENRSDEHFIIMQAANEVNKQDMKANKKDSDDKMTNIKEYFKAIIASSITSFIYHINTFKYLPTQKYSPKPMVPPNRRAPPLDSRHSTKIGGIWTLKHEISSPKFY